MTYHVVYARRGMEELRGLERPARALVYGWIAKNLEGCADPRRFGEGDAEGGRWRYRVGEYRLIAEIEEERIVILAVSTGLGLRRGGGRREAGPNVFLRSTLRQPVKTALLLLVTALITAAFVARASEYLLIRQETERLGTYYRALGTVEPLGGKTREADLLKRLEESPYVKLAERVRYPSAVMEGVYNLEGAVMDTERYLLEDAFFYGTLNRVAVGNERDPDHEGELRPVYKFYFTVDSVVAGYPEAVEAGDTVALINPSEKRDFGVAYRNLADLYEELEVGERYLLRGEYACYNVRSRLKGLVDETALVFKRLGGTRGPWYFPVPEGEADWDDPLLEGASEWIRIFDDNQHATTAVASRDVSALAVSRQEDWGLYLLEGRWPDSQDDAEGRRVCAVQEELAVRRNLQVGDRLTLTLRDLASRDGFLHQSRDLSRLDEIARSEKETYEIVGVFNSTSPFGGGWSNLLLPASACPETFRYGVTSDFQDVQFELTSPAEKRRFMEEAGETFSACGFRPLLADTGWGRFQAAVKPMERSALFNVAAFSVALLATLCLLTVLYFRMRRRDVAIARALGVPVGRCVREASLPLVLTGALGVSAGGIAGWRYTLENGEETLRSLAEFGEIEAALSPLWLALLWGGVLVVLSALAAGGALLLAGAPVLPLLQGGAAAQRPAQAPQGRLAAGAAAPAGSPVPVRPFTASAPPAPAKGWGAAYVCRFVWRHIVRARVKTALAVLLAAAFTVGLSAIRLSIEVSQERVDELYDTTVVEMDLIQDKTIIRPAAAQNDGFIAVGAVEEIRETGAVADSFLLGGNAAAILPYEGTWTRRQNIAHSGEGLTHTAIRSFDNLAEFMEESGSELTVTYHDGWDADLFARDWAAADAQAADADPVLFPVLLPLYLYEDYGLRPGSVIGVSCGSFRVCEAAGYYEGIVSGSPSGAPLLMANSAVEAMAGERMLYAQAHFSLDTAKNREIDRFQAVADSVAAGTGRGVPLRAVIWDDELRQAVEPLEDSIVLMRLLYPVVLALSLLVAAGIAALFVMTSAREAAILRVLGTSKLRSRTMLVLQNGLTSLAGLLLGLLAVAAYTGRARPELLAGLAGAGGLCAALYLLAAVLGAAASAVSVTGKHPLELLQARE